MKKELRLFQVVLLLLLACMLFVSARPASAFFLGCDNSSPANLFGIDPSGGTAAFIGALPESMTECEYDTVNGRFYAQASDGSFTLYRIDPATGASLGSVSTGAALNGMEFVGNTLYAAAIACSNCPSDLVTVNPATGALTTIGATGLGPITGLAYNSATGTMYGVTGGGAPASLVTVNLSTGAATIVGPTGLTRIGSIAFSGNGILYGGLTGSASASPNFLVSINTATGAATPLFDTGFSITGLALYSPPSLSVPTISEWGMILFMVCAGLGSLYYLKRQGGPDLKKSS